MIGGSNRAVNSVKNDTEECIEPAAGWCRHWRQGARAGVDRV